MKLTWLGWAGVELEVGGATVVIDALHHPGAVFAAFGERAAGTPLPAVVPAAPGRAVAGLLTHLHRDHADAEALRAALVQGAPVMEPPAAVGDGLEGLALAQADHELTAAGLERRRCSPGDSFVIDPFIITALPASDGLGDPQIAWLVEAGGVRVLHLGDTVFHGAWWRMALRYGPFDVVLVPVNGAVVNFPHRRPASRLPAVMDPAQAAMAVELLGARLAIPIHAEGYEIAGIYEPVPDAGRRFVSAATEAGIPARTAPLGEPVTIEARVAPGG